MRGVGTRGLVALLLLAGCGNAVSDDHLSGLAGLTKSADGDLVVVAYVCRDRIDRISVVRDREGQPGDEANRPVATFTARSPLEGLVRFDVADHADGWTPSTPLAVDPSVGLLFTAEGTGDDGGETSTAWLAPGRLDTVEAGSIYTSDDADDPTLTPHTTQEFVEDAKAACRR